MQTIITNYCNNSIFRYNDIRMKKFLAILLSIQLLSPYAIAAYDFSDEAQAEFDKNKNVIYQTNDFAKTQKKKQLKKQEKTEEILIEDSIPPLEPAGKMEPELDYNRANFTPQINQELLVPLEPQFYGSVVEIPAGTSFSVTFDSGISSGSLEKDDRLTVRLTNDLVYNGKTIAPAGSLVYGTATDAQNAGYAYGSGEIELNFNEILTPEGTLIKIQTENIYLRAQSERAKKMTRDIVLGALGSLLIGAAFTAMGGGDNWGRNMAIYGGLGAVSGGIRGGMQRGQEVQIPDGTTIQVKLIERLKAEPYSL